MRNVILFILIFLSFISTAQINSYIRKGSRAVEKNKLERAKQNYFKAYSLDKTSYEANLGLGFVLSEFMNKYEEALPYLETAYSKNPTDTFPDLIFSLAKCYHHKGEYQKAKDLYSKLAVKLTQDKEQDDYNIKDLDKRIEDCIYGIQHKEDFANKINTGNTVDKNMYVGNLGSKVNTDMPEYVPVVTDNNELYFTSRRKDFEKEKKSKIDDKYFENIYVSKLINGRPTSVSTFSLSKETLKTKTKKKHLSIISASHDGKNMFVFQDNKIHEIKTESDNSKSTLALSKNVNMDFYQNHASISKDGKTLFFTSEDARGNGGLDIYKSIKESNGEWGVPENLGKTINTPFDEDAPFLSEDGQTLYFSSKGHPGFGNYDVYKSTLVNGKWSAPENMSQPVNSAGNDIFLIQTSNNENSYFSSYRPGGYGDMDIYKITYLNTFKKECAEKRNSLLSLDSKIIDKENFSVKFEATIPSNIKAIAYQWTFNQTKIAVDASQITQAISLTSPGDSVFVKVIAGCDTCIDPIVLCNNLIYNVPADIIPVVKVDEAGKNPYDDKLILPYLNKSQLEALGLNLTPIHFNLNKSNIREDAVAILKSNIDVLSKHPELSILIYGFADSRGKESYNLPLSKKRAQHVKDYLVSKGLNKKQIEQVNGKGEEFILNKCTEGIECTDIEHETNRRVEFIIFENKK
jgi:outer membrane protein OmpA-like peptidoglycan-associated protein/tetratricopeptide (TPR) repeat protein